MLRRGELIDVVVRLAQVVVRNRECRIDLDCAMERFDRLSPSRAAA